MVEMLPLPKTVREREFQKQLKKRLSDMKAHNLQKKRKSETEKQAIAHCSAAICKSVKEYKCEKILFRSNRLLKAMYGFNLARWG